MMNPAQRIDEINSFLGFVMTQWPDVREQAADQLVARCSRCILPETYSPLIDGRCESCRGNDSAGGEPSGQNEDAERALREILSNTAGSGSGPYDAVVLFSGGKDSAYLLHRLTSEFPSLRLAALTVDNSFMSSVALANCRQILSRLPGIDHFVLRPKRGLYARAFRHALTHLEGQGCYAKVDRMDGDLTFDIGRNFAATLAAPLLISGLSPEQVERILGLTSFEAPPEVEHRRRTHSADFALDELYDADELDQYWWNPDRWPAERRPRVLHPFHAWRYDEEFIPREVVRLGLIDPGQDNPLITNNDTIPVMLAVDSVNLGYSSFEPEFAQLIRDGKADREMWLALFQAIEYQAKRGEFLPHCIADTLERLDLQPGELGLGPLAL